MAKDKVTVTIDSGVLAVADADAAGAGLNRSEYVQAALVEAHYARLLAAAAPVPLPVDEQQRLAGVLAWQNSLVA